MKVLLTVHCFYPTHIFGSETYTLEIARTLKAMGHEVAVLTADSHTEDANGRDYVYYEYESIPVYSINTAVNPNKVFRDTYYKEANNEVIVKIIKQFGPDIIHCIHTINLTVAFLQPIREMGIPAIVTLTDFYGVCFNCKLQRHDNSFCTGPNAGATNCLECYFEATKSFNQLREKSGFVGKAFSSLRSFSLISRLPFVKKVPLLEETRYITERKDLIIKHYEAFSKLIAPTSFLEKMYKKNGYPANKIQKLTFGLNMEPFEGYEKPRESFDRDLTFGYIGQLYWHKGVDLLVEAFNKLDNPNLKLKIYGDPNQDYYYTQKLNELKGQNPNINLLGTFPRTELGKILSEIDVLVIPSLWYENAPLVLLGALATRTPVIASDVDGMNEFIRHDESGFLFKTGDLEALRTEMQKCVDNPQDLVRISRNADYRKSIKDNVEEYLQIYNECINKR